MGGFRLNKEGNVAVRVAKIAAVTGFLAIVAAQGLSASLTEGRLADWARLLADGADPIVTGSLAKSAAGTRLDPCEAQFRR